MPRQPRGARGSRPGDLKHELRADRVLELLGRVDRDDEGTPAPSANFVVDRRDFRRYPIVNVFGRLSRSQPLMVMPAREHVVRSSPLARRRCFLAFSGDSITRRMPLKPDAVEQRASRIGARPGSGAARRGDRARARSPRDGWVPGPSSVSPAHRSAPRHDERLLWSGARPLRNRLRAPPWRCCAAQGAWHEFAATDRRDVALACAPLPSGPSIGPSTASTSSVSTGNRFRVAGRRRLSLWVTGAAKLLLQPISAKRQQRQTATWRPSTSSTAWKPSDLGDSRYLALAGCGGKVCRRVLGRSFPPHASDACPPHACKIPAIFYRQSQRLLEAQWRRPSAWPPGRTPCPRSG